MIGLSTGPELEPPWLDVMNYVRTRRGAQLSTRELRAKDRDGQRNRKIMRVTSGLSAM